MATPTGPLTGYRVLDLGGPLSLHCSKLLADMGADVIKIEAPAGDESRRVPPFKDDQPHPEKSLYFLHFNTNKRGITLDLTTPDGVRLVKDLVKGADAVIENYSAGVLPKLGLDY
ncbi:MAG: CoA transferase, partial [Candidatus Binatia bacterium]